MEYGLVGAKLGHSFSPELHRAIGGYEYGLTELTEAELAPFFRARAFRGVNVTIPYKSAVIPLLDEVSPEARRIGAVNTVVNRGGRLFGYNTDYDGMRYLLERTGIDLFGRRVLILGSGGTSLTALALAHDLGAAQIRRVSRTPRGADMISYAEAAEAGAETDVPSTRPRSACTRTVRGSLSILTISRTLRGSSGRCTVLCAPHLWNVRENEGFLPPGGLVCSWRRGCAHRNTSAT